MKTLKVVPRRTTRFRFLKAPRIIAQKHRVPSTSGNSIYVSCDGYGCELCVGSLSEDRYIVPVLELKSSEVMMFYLTEKLKTLIEQNVSTDWTCICGRNIDLYCAAKAHGYGLYYRITSEPAKNAEHETRVAKMIAVFEELTLL